MEITCPSCQSRFALKTDRMLPRGPFRVVCGKCRHPFTVDPGPGSSGPRSGEPPRLGPPPPGPPPPGPPSSPGSLGSLPPPPGPPPGTGSPARSLTPPQAARSLTPPDGRTGIPQEVDPRRHSAGHAARGLGSILVEPEGRFLLGGEPVPAGEEANGPETISAPAVPGSAVTTDAASKAPVEEFAENLKLALLCDGRADRQALARASLGELGFRVHTPPGPKEGLAWLYQNKYELVLLHEEFGGGKNELVDGLRGMAMTMRRHLCVGLLSRSMRTMDHLAAFHQSVNFVVNERDLLRLKSIARTALTDNDEFYRIFKETLKQLGKT